MYFCLMLNSPDTELLSGRTDSKIGMPGNPELSNSCTPTKCRSGSTTGSHHCGSSAFVSGDSAYYPDLTHPLVSPMSLSGWSLQYGVKLWTNETF